MAAEKTAYRLEAGFRSNNRLHDLVGKQANEIMALLEAQGMVLRIGGTTQSFGVLPEKEVPYDAIAGQAVDGISVCENLGALAELNEEQTARASGAAYLQLSEEGDDFLLLVREEYEQIIRWAGKPGKVETVGEDGVKRLSPRGSFALWRQERRGCSKPFSYVDREIMRILRRAFSRSTASIANAQQCSPRTRLKPKRRSCASPSWKPNAAARWANWPARSRTN